MKNERQPAYLWYTGHWKKATDVRACTLAARGLWREMLDLMHDSPRRGYLQLANGQPMSDEQLANAAGAQIAEVRQLLSELKTSGVYSCTNKGVIYSRKMVRDEAKRIKCISAGKLGGNPTLKGQDNPPGYPSLVDVNVKPELRSNEGNETAEQIRILYGLYPRKKSPQRAKAAIAKALSRAKFDVIQAGLLRYVDERKGQDPTYTKHPATWFNGDCWADEPDKLLPRRIGNQPTLLRPEDVPI